MAISIEDILYLLHGLHTEMAALDRDVERKLCTRLAAVEGRCRRQPPDRDDARVPRPNEVAVGDRAVVYLAGQAAHPATRVWPQRRRWKTEAEAEAETRLGRLSEAL